MNGLVRVASRIFTSFLEWVHLFDLHRMPDVLFEFLAARFCPNEEWPQSTIIIPVSTPRVFIVAKNSGWEYEGLVASWDGVADYTYCDELNSYDPYSVDWTVERKKMVNEQIIEQLSIFSENRKCDFFFSYLSGRWLMSGTIAKIRRHVRAAVNISFDDTPSFWGDKTADGRWSGNAQICREYDLNVTCQNPKDVLKYHLVGARALFLPPGGNENVYYAVEEGERRREGIVFVGQKYGKRVPVIERLLKQKIPIKAYGKGWPGGPLQIQKLRKELSSTLIAIGFGYIGNGPKTGLKARDFEIPLTGCCYVTSFHPVLAQCFKDGKEIVFYQNPVELGPILADLLSNPARATEIGENGRQRALREHTWRSRWSLLLSVVERHFSGKLRDDHISRI